MTVPHGFPARGHGLNDNDVDTIARGPGLSGQPAFDPKTAFHGRAWTVHNGRTVYRVQRGDTMRSIANRFGHDVSMLKVFQTELYQRITETMLDVAGEYSGLLEPMEGNRALNPAGLFLQSRPTSIYSGTNEIQRNIVAKNVLELPG